MLSAFKFIKKHILHPRILKFGLVGISGVLVNMGVYWCFKDGFHLDYRLASIIAIETSIITNFLLNDLWTWKDREKQKLYMRLLKYHMTAVATSLIFNLGLLILLHGVLHMNDKIANLIGILIGAIVNFLANNFWTFKNRSKERKR